MDQLDIFSYMKHNPIKNACCVIKDGVCVDLTWKELFDESLYDSLKCVTYVSSGSFFEKSVGKFKNIEIVIGIEKGDVKRAFDESVRARMQSEGDKLFDSLSDEAKQRIIERNIIVRYSLTDTIIHSKFYILSNRFTGANRVIVGSANLTESAFSNGVNQFEDILVFDNSEYFNIYEKRFESILEKTSDYISEEHIENYKEGKLVSVGDFTAEEKTENLLKRLEKENIIPLINDGVLQKTQELQAQEEKELSEVRTSYEVISAVTKKSRKSDGYIIKTPKELETVKPKIIDILFKGTKQEFELARFALNYNEADKKQYRVYVSEDGKQSERNAEIYDRKAGEEEIIKSIDNLNRFISAYKDFVSSSDSDNENLSHVMETILYAFTAAYIFKLRQETTSSRKTDIPIMMIIGGRASSGKSSLLAYIDAILSGRHLSREDHYYQYEKLTTGKKSLENLFMSENTYPLLVDEVAPGFFNSKSSGKGEALIKYLANTLDGKHPAMICTTNTDTFNIPAQVARRIYYVQVDACFDENCKGQATAYYEDVMQEADNLLFRDFCYRMGEKISHHDDLFGEGDFDFLFCARQIFKEYYSIANQEVPEYMPMKLYQDYANRGKEMWKVLFQQDQTSFDYKEDGKTGKPELVVNLKDITTGTKDVNVYMNYLRQDLLVEAAGIYTILRADAFFEWIGVKNPWKKDSLIEKIFGKRLKKAKKG